MVSTLFDDKSTSIFSGVIITDYSVRNNAKYDTGLVSIGYNGVTPLQGYSALSSVMATAKPTFTASAEYTPTAGPPSCPTDIWNLSVLPPKPHTPLCDCLMKTLRCIANETAVAGFGGTNFDNVTYTLCDHDVNANCTGIYTDGQRGDYGAFSMCNVTVKYSWVADLYYKRTGECSLNNTAELRGEGATPSGDCAFLMQQVGERGEKTLTAFLQSTPTSAGTLPNTDASTGGSHLSIGAKAGIAIGVFVFVVLALLATLFVLNRKKKARKKDPPLPEHDQPDLPEFVPPTREMLEHEQRQSGPPEHESLAQLSQRT
ncbi:carbohydrate-binding module family 43 protein [Lentithecium fluviatile CBS 122367]|uniref:Carbohydrate-binding module family 43 protein n=1 Tax=Lentithecium fluviatile CBS 122367 TaxID=1168545 RepID=A0A6G1IFT9_9PLEO|nr:carbohydrate-binding module family 43 protein [Lentithecium fluviatile CBS 122367]